MQIRHDLFRCPRRTLLRIVIPIGVCERPEYRRVPKALKIFKRLFGIASLRRTEILDHFPARLFIIQVFKLCNLVFQLVLRHICYAFMRIRMVAYEMAFLVHPVYEIEILPYHVRKHKERGRYAAAFERI